MEVGTMNREGGDDYALAGVWWIMIMDLEGGDNHTYSNAHT